MIQIGLWLGDCMVMFQAYQYSTVSTASDEQFFPLFNGSRCGDAGQQIAMTSEVLGPVM